MEQLVYLNGAIVPYADAKVPVEDRGYEFGDGIYEVIRVYGGAPFSWDAHFERLRRSAQEIRLEVDIDRLQRDARDLLDRQGEREATIYLQVTRGVAPRNHAFPAGYPASVFMLVRPANPPSEAVRRDGVACITLADDRWARCYIKSINLLSNVLAKQQAVDAGAYEAIYVRDGFVTEGSSSNVFGVIDGALCTAPLSNYILGGITRDVLLDAARLDGITVREESLSLPAFRRATEVIVTSTTAELVPVVTLDGASVGTGRPGPMYNRLRGLFQAAIDVERLAFAAR